MNVLDKLEKHFGNWAIPNAILFLVALQVIVYGLVLGGVLSFSTLPLVPSMIINDKEYWRLATFVIAPPYIAGGFGIFFLLIFWYVFCLMGNSVEATWGAFRLNLYLLVGSLLTVIGAFAGQMISPESLIQIFPDFLYLSIFYAFAALNPNTEFHLFFVLPVKVKWLALVSGVFVALQLIAAESTGVRIAVLAPILNFFLFFGGAFIHSIRAHHRRREFQLEVKEGEEKTLHQCALCPATDKSHPDRNFRYRKMNDKHVAVCSQCREGDEGD